MVKKRYAFFQLSQALREEAISYSLLIRSPYLQLSSGWEVFSQMLWWKMVMNLQGQEGGHIAGLELESKSSNINCISMTGYQGKLWGWMLYTASLVIYLFLVLIYILVVNISYKFEKTRIQVSHTSYPACRALATQPYHSYLLDNTLPNF